MYSKEIESTVRSGFPVNHYIMLWDGEWWACTPDGDDLLYMGEEYRKVCPADFLGREGTRVLGVVKIEKVRHLMAYKYNFIYVKDEYMAGLALIGCISKYYNFRRCIPIK